MNRVEITYSDAMGGMDTLRFEKVTYMDIYNNEISITCSDGSKVELRVSTGDTIRVMRAEED